MGPVPRAAEARMTDPVAVVIPTYNHSRFLADAIASVERQTVPAAEIIVVDDGSTDHPEHVVAQFPGVRLIRQDNKGLAAARTVRYWLLRAGSATPSSASHSRKAPQRTLTSPTIFTHRFR